MSWNIFAHVAVRAGFNVLEQTTLDFERILEQISWGAFFRDPYAAFPAAISAQLPHPGLAAMMRVRTISLPQAGHKFLRSRLPPRMVVILTSQAQPAVMTVTIAGFLVGSTLAPTALQANPGLAVIPRSSSNVRTDRI